MAQGSPETLDLARLAAPVTEAAPTGPDPREDGQIFEVRRLRKAARALEDEADTAGSDAGPPGAETVEAWRGVFDQVTALLAESKDLELCAYLCEASLRCYGFAGLRDAFALTRLLVERYWDGLHPIPQDDEPAVRARVFESLNGRDGGGTLPQPIWKQPATDAAVAQPIPLWQAKATLERGEEEEKATLLRTVRQSGPAFYGRLRADLAACATSFDALTEIFLERCGERAAPASAAIRTALAEVGAMVESIAGEVPLPTPAPESMPVAGDGGNGAQPATPMSAPPTAAVPTGPVTSREQALRLIEAAADYFRRAEPHSPTAWALETVLRRSRMALPELLDDLLGDGDARERFLAAAGIKVDASR